MRPRSGLAARHGQSENRAAPLPPGSPSWSDIGDMTMAEVRAAARANEPGFKTILKLLIDSRFNR
jgi:hypothetical protein